MKETISPRHITDSRRLAELARPPAQRRGLRRHFLSMHFQRPLPEVFAFFADSANQEALMPQEFDFQVTPSSDAPKEGGETQVRFNLGKARFSLRIRTVRWAPPFGFDEVQVSGPFSVWRHVLTFTDEGDRIRVDEEVLYRLPLWPLGELAAPWAVPEITRLFEYRAAKLHEILGC